jgi:NAD(P)-dependent dehydrogenase (short-subunit alcohol dehydrogenase family)
MRVLITGAEQGLGEEIVKRIDRDYPDWVVHNIRGSMIRPWNAQTMIEQFIEGMGHHDLIINNFGINKLARLGTDDPANGPEIFQANVLAPYWVINAQAKISQHRSVKVINIASQTHRVPQRSTSLYCASKAALVMLTKTAARELAPHWQVNAIAPGRIVGTEMDQLTQEQVRELRPDLKDQEDYARSLIPMRRFTSTHEMAELVLKTIWLPSYVTGTVIEAMGGV